MSPVKLAHFRNGLSAEQRGTLLFALWTLIILVFFSFSSRQEYYVLPGLPGFALLLGGGLARETYHRWMAKTLKIKPAGRQESHPWC